MILYIICCNVLVVLVMPLGHSWVTAAMGSDAAGSLSRLALHRVAVSSSFAVQEVWGSCVTWQTTRFCSLQDDAQWGMKDMKVPSNDVHKDGSKHPHTDWKSCQVCM